MSQITLESGSNKKWMAVLGVSMTVVVAAVWWSRQSQASDRVQDAVPAAAQATAQVEADKMADSPQAAALIAAQAAAAKEIERQPEMKPVVGIVKERPSYVSQMEWAMLQGVAQQQTYPDKELTRMVNFLRFTKQLEAWDGLAKLDLAIMNVCSMAKRPERTAWGTTSVNTIHVVFGGNSNRYFGQSRWYSAFPFK